MPAQSQARTYGSFHGKMSNDRLANITNESKQLNKKLTGTLKKSNFRLGFSTIDYRSQQRAESD